MYIVYTKFLLSTALEGVSREWKAVSGNKAGSTVLPDEIVQIWGPGLHQKYLCLKRSFCSQSLITDSVTHHRSQKVLDDVRVCRFRQ